VQQGRDAFRAVVPPVIVHPASHHGGINQLCQLFERLIIPGRCHPLCADGLPESCGYYLGADRRQTDEVSFLPITSAAGLQCVAEEIKRHVFVTQLPIGIPCRTRSVSSQSEAPNHIQQGVAGSPSRQIEPGFCSGIGTPVPTFRTRACHRDRAPE